MSVSQRSLNLGKLSALALLAALACTPALAQPAAPDATQQLALARLHPKVVAGDSWIVTETTALQSLRLEEGGAVAAAPGKSLTMTVDGVETGLKPGHYRGNIVLTVTDRHPVQFDPSHTHHFRQALMLDASGVVANKSVAATTGPVQLKDGVLSGLKIRSKGENFNGLLVTGGQYLVKDLDLELDGNGGNDFAGFGAGVMSDGKQTRLVLDKARIRARGVVRTAVVCHNGSQLIVKNSDISARNGTLPPDYISNVTPGEMKDAPWMLGIKGTNRATNVLGDDTQCTYIGSRLVAEGWGVLSVDNSRRIKLTAINSQIEVGGDSGYGSYAIGDSTNAFYGSTIKAPSMGMIVTGGHAIFAASTADNVARLDKDLKLGLSPAERAALTPAQTKVESARYGVMLWGDGGTVTVRDGTVFDTGEATFLNKGSVARFDIDGSRGAQLNSRNGVLLQLMDNDDPGPQMTAGLLANTGVWRDPTTPVKKIEGYDLGAEHDTDTVAQFTRIRLTGDIFNAMRLRTILPPFNPDRPSLEPPKETGANLVVKLVQSELRGVMTSATARHLKDPIGAEDHESLGRVQNRPEPAINNGVLVRLDRSRWVVTGTSHLTRLTLDAASRVVGLDGRVASMTVNGVATPLRAGDYRGQIVVQVPAQ